jgi:hypothetical protein
MKCYEAVAAAETFVSTDFHSLDSAPPFCESTRARVSVRVRVRVRVCVRVRVRVRLCLCTCLCLCSAP